MARKAERSYRIGNVRGWRQGDKSYVTVTGWVDDSQDHDRPLRTDMSPADARRIAARLIEEADRVDPQVDFTEERPGVWKTATPADGERLDSLIDDALGKFGTSLEELRATAGEQERDETPTVCAACGRTRPRWTMASRIVDGSERFECSPKFAMNCADCCEPGEMLTHYTMEEHEHTPQRP
jgi:hypothetical protein